MKTFLMIAALFISSISFAQDQMTFSKSQLKGTVQWEVGPRAYDESIFILKIVKTDGSPAELEKLPEAELWMPTMGHGSSPTSVEKLSTGVYRVMSVYFVMTGPWEIKIKLTNQANVSETQVLSYRIK